MTIRPADQRCLVHHRAFTECVLKSGIRDCEIPEDPEKNRRLSVKAAQIQGLEVELKGQYQRAHRNFELYRRAFTALADEVGHEKALELTNHPRRPND